MGCIYEDRCDGMCSMSTNSDGELDKEQKQQGCDDEGICVVSDDPDPARSCDTYESDWSCHECGVDLNVNECECAEE